jgi:hypothetical protein
MPSSAGCIDGDLFHGIRLVFILVPSHVIEAVQSLNIQASFGLSEHAPDLGVVSMQVKGIIFL